MSGGSAKVFTQQGQLKSETQKTMTMMSMLTLARSLLTMRPARLLSAFLFLGCLLQCLCLCPVAQAADITWDAGASGTGTAWLTASNWVPDVVPTNTDNAIFGAAGSATAIGINMTTANGVQQVGAITMSAASTVSRTITNSTTGSNGVLVVNGVGGILLSNESSLTLTIRDGSSRNLGLGLGSSGDIFVAGLQKGSGGLIQIFSVISDVGGTRSINKTGGGILYLRGVNTYSGDTTNTAGTLQVDGTGTFGSGVGTLFLNGGDIICAADRSGGTPLSNPVVMSADTYIYNTAGTAGTSRTIPFSGPWSGSAGTLTIANTTPVANNTFQLRLSGGFTFSRDIVIGAGADTSGSFSVLQVYNPATNGTQTFSGTISSATPTPGSGSVWRSGAAASAPGTTIFTGNNTYAGGTRITYGTLLANNVAGSAFGSGPVTVTNQGVVGGSGTVSAQTTVSLGGTLSPGSASTNVGNFTVSDLVLGESANYLVNVTAATGAPGTAWDVATVSGTWTDSASISNPITIKIDSLGATPTGWNPSVARDWVIIDGGSSAGFDATHFAIDTSAFAPGTLQGVFSVSAVSGDLHLIYTPVTDIVINVAAGTVNQGGTTPTPYPLLTGTLGVLKVGNGEVVFTNSLNDYAGSTKIYAGTVSVNVDAQNNIGAFGNASSSLLLGNTVGTSNATLNINTAGVTVGRSVTVQTGSTGVKTIGTTITSGAANFTGDIALQDSVMLAAPSGGTALFAGDITGTGGVTKSGAGTLTLSSANNTYSGNTVVSNGTLNLIGKAGTGTFVLAGPTTIDNPGTAPVTLSNTSNVWAADLYFTGTTNLSIGTSPVTLIGTRVVAVSNNTLTVGGIIGGSGGITKTGAGTLALTTSSNGIYSGTTTLSEGLLTIGASTTFGDGTGTLVLGGGTLGLTGTRNLSNSIIANPINLTADTIIQNTTSAAAGTRNLPFGGPVTTTAGTLTIRNIASANANVMHVRLHAGGINFTRPVVFDNSLAGNVASNTCQLGFYNTNGTVEQTITGVISGPGSIIRSALYDGTGGTTILTAQNTFTLGATIAHGYLGLGASSIASGGVVISGPVGTGTLEIDDDTVNGLPTVGVFAAGGARTLDNRVWLNGPTNVLFGGTNNLTFAGLFDVGGVAKTLTVSNTGLTTISGLMTNSSALTKAGPGTLVLSGYNNFRTNTTTVAEGSLLVDNTVGSGTGLGAVILTNNGTLGGTGTVSGPVFGPGNIAPGHNVGTLTLQGGLDLSSGGTYVWELGANSTNSSFDVISLTGSNLVLGGSSKISINFTGSATAPDSGNAFWQSARQWTVIALSGTATNDPATAFPTIINGTSPAGSFTNFADANGNIVLQFTPSGVTPPPQPVLDPKIVGANTASATLTWSALNGTTYTVQYKTNLVQANWITLGTSTATGSTASFTDTTGPRPQVFYRVIWP